MRRALGFVLFVTGGFLLAFAIGRYTVGWYRAERARAAWDRNEARIAVEHAENVARRTGRPETVAEGAPVARLVIDRIGLDAIVLEGVDGEDLNAGPGHLPGSAFPGENGNAVISAHRDRHFDRLDEVQVGDTIRTESGQFATRWIVIGRRVVGRAQPALFTTHEPTLTLTTCWPIRYLGPAPDRLIVTARPLPQRARRASRRLASAAIG